MYQVHAFIIKKVLEWNTTEKEIILSEQNWFELQSCFFLLGLFSDISEGLEGLE